jgi:PQQ-dependent dehydrogenase (methanol/ethanol family)
MGQGHSERMLSPEVRVARGGPRVKAAARAVAAMSLGMTATVCGQSQSAPGDSAATQSAPPAQPADSTRARPGVAISETGEWTMAARDYASTRYSGLDEINVSNAGTLRVAWTFSTGVVRGHEAAPLVVGTTMFIVTPYPNTLYALDLTKPAAPVKWRVDPKPVPAAQGVACCDVVNRGAAYADGRVFFNTLDNQTIAVDANTGRLLWRVTLGDIHKGESMTMAPLVVKGKVLVGNSGGEFGVHGWLTALDAVTGRIAWRAYATGPDSLVLIGPRFKPFYESDRGPNLGVTTWPPDAWRMGGGAAWGWISYDPELDLVYYGTANPGPWNAEQRPGDNKWTAGTFARDPDTGEAVWFYQWSPHDLWDHDGVNEHVLLDMPVNGTVRKVLVRPERNGYMYVLDRSTGEVLSADPFVKITSSRGVDLATGRLIPEASKFPRMGKVIRDVCPASPGAKDWQPSAFSPRTGLLYVPHQHLCMDWESVEANYIAGTPYVGANVKYRGVAGRSRGAIFAWDPVARRKVWDVAEQLPVWSGALVTGGDVVFYGTLDGVFKALDARTGSLLWSFKTQSGIIGQPVSYRGPDGRQYIAVLSGVGGWPGTLITVNADTRDSTAGIGWASVLADLQRATTMGGMLYVFSLP